LPCLSYLGSVEILFVVCEISGVARSHPEYI
jgi:hypothetical protein